MIGKPEWFARRKYSGWGITPKTWQGWIYIAVIILPFIAFQAMPFWTVEVRLIVTGAWLLFLFVDVFDIMIRMKKDEREKMHEAIAERNALWAMMAVIIIGILIQVTKSALNENFSELDWFLVIALFVGLIAKSVSNFYLEKFN